MGVTVAISFQESLLADIDRLAKKERRTRSELIREAARLYVERRNRWNKTFALGDATASGKGLDKQDIAAEIQVHRGSKAARRP